MAGEFKVQVTGLKEFQKALKHLDAELPKELKERFLGIASNVADIARGKVPVRTGRAAKSIKPHGTLKGASVTGGGARTAYYPWLDYGGAIGSRYAPQRDVNRRPFMPGGRYIYPAAKDQLQETYDAAKDALRDVAKQAGFGWEEL